MYCHAQALKKQKTVETWFYEKECLMYLSAYFGNVTSKIDKGSPVAICVCICKKSIWKSATKKIRDVVCSWGWGKYIEADIPSNNLVDLSASNSITGLFVSRKGTTAELQPQVTSAASVHSRVPIPEGNLLLTNNGFIDVKGIN